MPFVVEPFTPEEIQKMALKCAEMDKQEQEKKTWLKFIAHREKQIIENDEKIKGVIETVQEVLNSDKICKHKIPVLEKMMNDQIKKIQKETTLFKEQIKNTKKTFGII